MKELGAFKANMYLAEDRILCYEIVARKNCNWLLHYVKNAVAETDTPETLDVLIRQRRRWLNGSFFASLYTIIHFNRLWKDSTHSLFMKCAFSIQFTYYFFNIGEFSEKSWLVCR
jgi:chitin synthase